MIPSLILEILVAISMQRRFQATSEKRFRSAEDEKKVDG